MFIHCLWGGRGNWPFSYQGGWKDPLFEPLLLESRWETSNEFVNVFVFLIFFSVTNIWARKRCSQKVNNFVWNIDYWVHEMVININFFILLYWLLSDAKIWWTIHELYQNESDLEIFASTWKYGSIWIGLVHHFAHLTSKLLPIE